MFSNNKNDQGNKKPSGGLFSQNTGQKGLKIGSSTGNKQPNLFGNSSGGGQSRGFTFYYKA